MRPDAPVDRAAALRMLRRLCRTAESEVPDYDTARQFFWAFRTIYQEIEPGARPDAPIAKVLNDLDRRLGFSLPGERKQVPIEETLGQRLKTVCDFDPEPFRDAFAELGRQVADLK